jgi:GNAT superfamily N-acetyltransferase
MTQLRPLLPADVPAAEQVAWDAIWEMAVTYEHATVPDRTPDVVERSQRRISHLQAADPDGAWVAVQAERVVGLALSLRRGPMWFLSLLAVSTHLQARGIGKQLLEASLRTASDAAGAWLLATVDPKALRRYALAGFAPHPSYTASGPLDRSVVPSDLGIREGDWAADGQLVDDVVTLLRGAPYGPDLAPMAASRQELLVAEEGRDRGFAILRAAGVASLGATTPALAQRLLWAALAHSEQPAVTVEWLTAEQQWAIDVAVAARLPLRGGSSVCIRSALGPMTPYLPGGAYG